MHNVLYTTYIPMTQMIRKHVLLPLPLNERIKLVARKDHKPEAAVIRELLETGLETKQQQQGSVGQALRKLADIGKEVGATGPTDLSQNIDKYLYKKPKSPALVVADTSGLMSLLVDTDAN